MTLDQVGRDWGCVWPGLEVAVWNKGGGGTNGEGAVRESPRLQYTCQCGSTIA